MNKNELWQKWEPSISGLSKKYTIKLVANLVGEFGIYLYDAKNKHKVHVNFYDSTNISRRTNIKYRAGEFEKLALEYGENFFKDWTFFKILKSEYVRELIEESCETLNEKYCIHFVIVGSNCVVDVIASYEPKIEFIE